MTNVTYESTWRDYSDHVQIPPTDANPSPNWSVEQVVQLQIKALKYNDTPTADTGIRTARRFASPANKRGTGSPAQFAAMVHNANYDCLLNFERCRYRPVDAGGTRWQSVLVKGGREYSFVWQLSLQTGADVKDCWMTDAVMKM